MSSLCNESPLSCACVAALISYLELLNKEDKFGQFLVEKYDLSQYVLLDSAAASALNLFSTTQTASQQRQPADSIYNLLNHCHTAQVKHYYTTNLLKFYSVQNSVAWKERVKKITSNELYQKCIISNIREFK